MFRFTIRDVLWLTVVVALAVGWWLDSRRSKERDAVQESALEANERLKRSFPD